MTRLLVNNAVTRVITSGDQVRIIEVAKQGPQGIPGPAGVTGGVVAWVPTSGPIGGQRVIAVDGAGLARYADKDAPGDAAAIVGISTAAVAAGLPVPVQQSGELADPSFNFFGGQPVFLGNNGLLTQVAPTSGFCKILGTASGATTLQIQLQPAITLA